MVKISCSVVYAQCSSSCTSINSSQLHAGCASPLLFCKEGQFKDDCVWGEWDLSWNSRRWDQSGWMADYSNILSCGKNGGTKWVSIRRYIHFSQLEESQLLYCVVANADLSKFTHSHLLFPSIMDLLWLQSHGERLHIQSSATQTCMALLDDLAPRPHFTHLLFVSSLAYLPCIALA